MSDHAESAGSGCFAASRLRIPDLLAAAPRTAEELAVATGAQPAALHRLLRALTGLEVVTVDGERFALTPLGRSLCAGPHSAAASAVFMGSPVVWSAWGALGDAVFDGQAAFRHAHGMGLFGYLCAHPDETAAFQALMIAQSRLQTPAVLAAL
jgi:Dimerisation domain/O-methyltransferase domain